MLFPIKKCKLNPFFFVFSLLIVIEIWFRIHFITPFVDRLDV